MDLVEDKLYGRVGPLGSVRGPSRQQVRQVAPFGKTLHCPISLLQRLQPTSWDRVGVSKINQVHLKTKGGVVVISFWFKGGVTHSQLPCEHIQL